MDTIRFWLKVLLAYAKDYVLENPGLKILALLITAVLWLSVASRPVSEITLHNIPIEMVNLPKSPNLIPSKYDTLTASVTFRGPRDTLDSLRSDELTVLADMTGIEPGVRVIPLKIDRSRLPSNVDPTEIDPSSIRVTVEREVNRDVPIKPRFDGQPPAGYEVYGWRLSPEQVEIVGAASQVRQVNDVSTETVSLSGKTSSFSQMVAVDIGSANVNIGDNTRKSLLTVTLGETRKERVVSRVPVTVVGAPPRYRPFPRFVDVKIFGPGSVVAALTAADVTATVDYSNRDQKTGEIEPSIAVAGDSGMMKVLSVTPDRVRVLR